MSEAILTSVMERGDLAHLALFLWAAAITLLSLFLLRELSAANRRFSAFVEELARLNRFLNRALRRPLRGLEESDQEQRASRGNDSSNFQ